MKMNCHKEDLIKAVQTVSKAISSKNTLPVLAGLLLIAEDGKFTMRATDLDIAIQCEMAVDVEQAGEVVIADGRRFAEIVKQLPDTDLSLQLVNDYDLKIGYGESSLMVRGFEAEQFPALPNQQATKGGVIASEVFVRMVNQVYTAASNDESKPVFTGIMLEIEGDDLVMVATDTHRLNLSRGHWTSANQDSEKEKIIIPAKTMKVVAGLAQGCQAVSVQLNRNNIIFVMDNTIFMSRIINGQYPDYKQVFPKEEAYTTRVMVNKRQLLETLSRARLLARDNSSIIKLNWEFDHLTITADSPDIGNIKEEINATIQGKDLLCAYNVKYLLDALSVIESEQVLWRLTGSLTPAIIREEENEDYVALILPIRLS